MKRSYLRPVCLGGAVVVSLLDYTTRVAEAHSTYERVSVRTDGHQARGSSDFPAISANGKFVVFHSSASNLVADDTNDANDVFMRDLVRQKTERISVSSAGVPGNADSGYASISANGRFVVFSSDASNLVPADTNGISDVFVRDRRTKTTTRISVRSGGGQAGGGSIGSAGSVVSANGRIVAFVSDDSDLVPNDTNGQFDVFVHDICSNITRRISVASDGREANSYSNQAAISADGRFVAFISNASNLVSSDTNGVADVFLHDLRTGMTRRVDIGAGGVQANAGSNGGVSISSSGRFVAFSSDASNLVSGDTNDATDVFIRDLLTDLTVRESLGERKAQLRGQSFINSISGNGAIVAFEYFDGYATDDRKNDSEVYLRNRNTNKTISVTSGCLGATVMGCSANGMLSESGKVIGFQAYADYLVPHDTNEENDIFIRRLEF